MSGLTLGILGIDHGHIFGMLKHMLSNGCTAKAWWTSGAPVTEAKFCEVHGGIPRVDNRSAILDDPEIDLVLIAAIPKDRAALAIAAMEAGKDVMTDKPGCTTRAQLDELRAAQGRTGRIWSRPRPPDRRPPRASACGAGRSAGWCRR